MKKGFKETDIGILPEYWEVKNIFDSSYIKARIGWQGLTTKEYLRYGTYYLVTGTDFNNGEIDWSNCAYVDEMRYSADKNIQIKNDDILITKDGTIGKVAYINNFKGKATLNSGVFVIRPKGKSYFPLFLSYIFKSNYFSNFLNKLSAGSTISHLYQKDFLGFKYPFPLLSEQTAIAQALNDVDELINSLDKLIAKKRNIKQAAMQQLLTGKKRLPGSSGKWETKKLGEIFTITAGGDLDKRDYSLIKEDKYCYPIFSNSLKDEGLYGYSSSYTQNPYTITVTARGTVGKAIARNCNYTAIGRVLILNPLAKVDCLFIAECINNLIDFANESTSVPQLTAPQISNYEITITSFEEQTAIANIFTDINSEIETLEKTRNKYKSIKQGMMQQLLTGKIRLIVPNIDTKVIPLKNNTHHNWEFNEAVVISVLTKYFGSEDYPLGRKRYTKLSYLLHRHVENTVKDYLKKAAGPYNPKTKYKGAEKIALENEYVKEHVRDNYNGFIAAKNINKAEIYFNKWYGQDKIDWLKQFRYCKNDDLELWTTVDMAINDLLKDCEDISILNIKKLITNNKEWKAKLERPLFSDDNIESAKTKIKELFNNS